MDEYKEDYQDAHCLFTAVNEAKKLYDMLQDIKTTAGSEAYKHSLAFYKHLGFLSEQNYPVVMH